MKTSLVLQVGAALGLAAGCAHAQLNKCVGDGGLVTYSDRACPPTAAASAIKAPPIAEPTRRDALAAAQRRHSENREAQLVELRRQIQELQPKPGPANLGGHGQRGLEPSPPPDPDSAKCAGIRHQQRRAKFEDPLGHDRSIHAMELQRAAARHCAS